MRLWTAIALFSLVAARQCPDSQYSCPDDSTCCKLENDEWGCCPMMNAVCCADGVHCCPDGSRCDTQASRCILKSGFTALAKKTRAQKKSEANEVVCPDGESMCPTGSTCCLQRGGSYGCCPAEGAVCCRDQLHCCPHGTQCDPSGQRCVNREGWEAVPWLKKFPSARKEKSQEKSLTGRARSRTDAVDEDAVLCPDGRSKCPDGTTCCRLKSGGSGCCPRPRAVCCADGVHCCPHGTQCDTGRGRCLNSQGDWLVWLTKVPAQLIATREEHELRNEEYFENEEETFVDSVEETSKGRDVACPDGKSRCPTDTTCCLLSGGKYGCCPTPAAVCCVDGVHCCPHGTQCDPIRQRCVNREGWEAVPWLTKFKSTPIRNKPAIQTHHPHDKKVHHLPSELRPIECGTKKTCPALSTCCAIEKEGQMYHMCCPLQNAVCCGSSCCPHGFQCIEGGRCEKKARHFQQWIN